MFPFEQSGLLDVLRRPDPRNSGRRVVERVRDLACRHVHLVTAGERDDQVRILDACPHEYGRVRGMPQHTPDVEPLLQFLQVRGIDIDDGDVIFLT